jgi:threonine dehydrogenase-like Zn-dependent dehydrogenase
MNEGDILGHEPMGAVEEVGSDVNGVAAGDRVVIPFQISCGHCFMCEQQLFTQCETTQVRYQGMGAALFGYTKLYGEVPGGQAQFLRVPQAQTTTRWRSRRSPPTVCRSTRRRTPTRSSRRRSTGR